MTDIKIENIIAYAQIADSFNVEQLSEMIPAFLYSPDEFSGVTMKLDKPKTAVLILSNGKAICTGAKTIEDAEISIKKVINKIKVTGVKVTTKPKVETQNIIASLDVEKELHLSSISNGLIMENSTYEPDKFAGLIYKMDDPEVELLLFSSGKIVCTGAKSLEDASKALEMMREKLTSIGAL
jgi:transcription initiation factor TFIID TATA-box-binding protein